jgi:hypothetical protein
VPAVAAGVRRYYEIVEDTLHPEFHYLYFAIRDCGGEIRTIQPSFISFS